jgi:hypothetical protein
MRKPMSLLTLGPDNEPMWVCLYVYPIGNQSAAMIVGNTVPPPMPGEVKGLGFFGATAEEAEQIAKAYPGRAEPTN